MARSSNPMGDLGGRVVRNVTARLVCKIVALAFAALLGLFGFKQCGKPMSREQAAAQATNVVNLNTATLEELMTLPRISEKLARGIVAGRPYVRVEDLERVHGIGPKTLEVVRARVTVRVR